MDADSTRPVSGNSGGVPTTVERERSSPLAILLVGGHALIRTALRNLLGGPQLAIVAEAADHNEALPIAEKLRPDVVLFDAPPTDAAARAGVEAVRSAIPDSCLVCLGGSRDLELSALHCIPPTAGLDDLHEAIATAVASACGRCILRPRCATVGAMLSRRERQVAVCIADGLPSKQIAAVLGIGLRTVNTYRESIARKLGASSAAVITRYVLEHRIQPG